MLHVDAGAEAVGRLLAADDHRPYLGRVVEVQAVAVDCFELVGAQQVVEQTARRSRADAQVGVGDGDSFGHALRRAPRHRPRDRRLREKSNEVAVDNAVDPGPDAVVRRDWESAAVGGEQAGGILGQGQQIGRAVLAPVASLGVAPHEPLEGLRLRALGIRQSSMPQIDEDLDELPELLHRFTS